MSFIYSCFREDFCHSEAKEARKVYCIPSIREAQVGAASVATLTVGCKLAMSFRCITATALLPQCEQQLRAEMVSVGKLKTDLSLRQKALTAFGRSHGVNVLVSFDCLL